MAQQTGGQAIQPAKPTLRSVLMSRIALQDTSTTADQLNSSIARVTNPSETPIYICALPNCNRLFPAKDRLMLHRKRDHQSDSDTDIITWNE